MITKTILFMILSITILITGCALLEKAQESEITYVESIPSKTKEQIFNGAKIWIAESFRSAKAVIEYENKDEGVLIGNGSETYPCFVGCGNSSSTSVSYTMRIDIKDEKVKITIFNIRSQQGIADGVTYSKRDEDGVRSKFLSYGGLLRTSIMKNSSANDW